MSSEKEDKDIKRTRTIVTLVIIAAIVYLFHLNNQYYEKRIERLEEQIYEYEAKIEELESSIEFYKEELALRE